MSVLDIIAVKQSNGAFKTSPFYIRFNRRAPEKTVVDVYINDQLVKNESSFQLVVNKGFKGVVFENIAESSKQSKNGTQEQPTPNSAGEDLAIDEELQHLHSTMPPSTYVEQFNLKQEINTIHFKLGKQETVKASLFVWDHTTKIVISDVDGTITKSDVIGPFAIKLGVQYFRPNTAAMLTSIHKAGYKILYLTRKPMSHIEFVRQFISKITQDGDTMPPGPVISTPYKDYYELAIKIWQGPTVFKKSMLKCIRGLYPEDHRPLEAGFGDKPTDIEAYIYAGVDPKKCFQIDKHGSVSVSAESKTYQGYLGVQNAVDKLFPSLSEAAAMITTELSQTVGNYVVDAGKSAVGSEP